MSTDSDKNTCSSVPERPFLKQLTGSIAALPITLTAALYSVSFAVIAYGGALPDYLDISIALTLLGSGVAVIISGLLGSLRGTVTHAQDATALLMAGAISPMVAGLATAHPPDAQFATALVFVVSATLLTGLAIFLAGTFRLSFVARFMPYPVISGLLVSIGYLLCTGSIGLVVRQDISLFALPRLAAEGHLFLWLPWAAGAVLMIIAGRWLAQSRVLPLGLFLGLVTFFGYLTITQTPVSEAERAGLLLGPFPEKSRLTELSVSFLAQADWSAVLRALPVVAALIPLAAVSGILNIQGIAQATGANHDLDADVRAMGIANIASGAVGGLICYPAVSTTLLGRHLNVPAVITWGATGAVCFAFAFSGTSLLGLLPRGLFALVVLYLGLSLLFETLVKDARRLPARDFILVLIILATTSVFGVFPALIVGITISIGIFIVSYARLPFLRSDTSLAVRRSIVERSEPNHAVLKSEGHQVRVLQLTGSLFFGTAFALRQHIHGLVASQATPIKTIILDFSGVRDVDTSALFSLERTLLECHANDIDLCLSGVRPAIDERFRRFATAQGEIGAPDPRRFETLDAALQKTEAEVLERYYASEQSGPRQQSFLSELQSALSGSHLSEIFPVISVADGEPVIVQNATSDEIYILIEGSALASVGGANGETLVVARFEPGALIGEMAYYLGAHRTATVVAEGDTRLMQIDLSRLEESGALPEHLISAFHLVAAKHLAQRLAVATKLLQSAMN